MGEVRELIERLEKATGPDRLLDALIWAATLPTTGIGIDGDGPPSGSVFEYVGEEDGSVSMYVRFAAGEARKRARRQSPPYTASIDAAVALAERVLLDVGWNMIGNCPNKKGEISGGARLYFEDGVGPPCEGATPAIALCLALLRAKEQETR